MTEPLIITKTPRTDHQLDLEIKLGPERTEQALQRAVRLVSQKARIPGFRPGKAPSHTVLRMFGREAVLGELLDDLGQEVYRETLEVEQIEPYGRADLTDMTPDPPTFKLTIPLQPTAQLADDYRSLRLETPAVTVTDADIDAIIEQDREQRATWQPVERPAAIGDVVVMDIKGAVAETSIMDNSDWELTLKEESGWLPGFDAVFVGLAAGEEKDFTLTYPEDSTSRFKGQEATFHATVKTVKAKVKPELTDEFAKSLGEYEDLADLRARLLDGLTKQRTTEAENKLHDAAIDALVEKATIAYPPQAVDAQVEGLEHDLGHRLQEIGYSLQDYFRLQGKTVEQYRVEIRPGAEKRLKGQLILAEFARREGLQVSAEETQAEYERVLSRAQTPEQVESLQKLFDNDAGRFMLRQDVLTEKTLARLRAVVTGQAPELPTAEVAAPATTTEAESASAAGELTESVTSNE